MEVALSKKWSKSALSQNECVGLYCATQYMHWKKDRINHSLDLTFDENNNKRKSSEHIRRNFEMVSGLNTADTSLGGAFVRNDICEYLWFKKQYCEDC